MGELTNQMIAVAVSTAAAGLSAKYPEMTSSAALLAGLTQLGAALGIGPAWEQARLKQAKCLSEAAEQVSQAAERTVVALESRQVEMCSEIVRTIGETIDEEKLAYLKNCLVNTALAETGDTAGGRYSLARIIRDITAHEIRFLVENRHKGIIMNLPVVQNASGVVTEQIIQNDNTDVVYVDSNQDPGLIAALTSFGLIMPTGTWVGGSYFTPLRNALCNLVMPAAPH